MSKKEYTREGMFGVVIQPKTLQETDKLRGDIPRSRWIERALILYNGSVKEQERSLGSSVSANGLVPQSAVQTPRGQSTTVE